MSQPAQPPAGSVSPPDAESDSSMLFSRTVVVEFSATPATWASQSNAVWKLTEAQAAKIFSREPQSGAHAGNKRNIW